ncbi:terminase small subunit [Agrococcus casei]|uniref:terminase small subunit n=1 Tax=Agrococcus casei TaxID=343512 RepID=UPI003F8F1DBD
MRVIVIAPSKRVGAAFAAEQRDEVVAILTPRLLNAAEGKTADRVIEAPGLTVEDRVLLTALAEGHVTSGSSKVNMVEATEKAIEAGVNHLTDLDAGAVEALRALARKIDAWDQIVEWAIEDAADGGGRPAVPQNDNVSISAYLKYCDQLGLSPAGRKALDLKSGGVSGKKKKLESFRERQRP